MRLAWAKPKTEKPSSPPPSKPLPIHNLFVANLHFEARSNDLLEFFKANGANVVSAEVIFNDNPRRSAGYGFVSLNTKEEADAALSSFDGKVILGLAACCDEYKFHLLNVHCSFCCLFTLLDLNHWIWLMSKT